MIEDPFAWAWRLTQRPAVARQSEEAAEAAARVTEHGAPLARWHAAEGRLGCRWHQAKREPTR